jgi:transposase
LKELLAIIADASDSKVLLDGRASLMVLAAQLQACQTLIATLEKRLITQLKSNERSRRLQTIPGIGVVGATAIEATMTDLMAFRSGRDFAAWIGLVPRQDSTGGKQKLGIQAGRPIPATHSGGGCARRSAACTPAPAEVSLAHRVVGAKAVQGRGAVALANKMARIAWALLARGGTYRWPQLAAAV